ncbi:MAG: ATPase [Clostridia bacterium]|nr:ATPase [Clostridia bacterium]
MELYRILDEFEAEIEESAKIPMTNKVIISEDILFKYIDKLRADLPEDIRQAQWIKKERQRILSDAEEEAQKIIQEAQKKVADLVDQTEVYKMAEKKGAELLQTSQAQSEEIIQGAFDYADEIMFRLEEQLEKNLTLIKKGREELKKTNE